MSTTTTDATVRRHDHAQFVDRFLSGLPGAVLTVGCCFRCQLFPRVETGPQDVPVSKMLIEGSRR